MLTDAAALVKLLAETGKQTLRLEIGEGVKLPQGVGNIDTNGDFDPLQRIHRQHAQSLVEHIEFNRIDEAATRLEVFQRDTGRFDFLRLSALLR